MLGRHIERIDNILQTDREAMQRPTLLDRDSIEGASLGEHGRRVEVRPRLEVGFTGLDAGNEGAGAGVSFLARKVTKLLSGTHYSSTLSLPARRSGAISLAVSSWSGRVGEWVSDMVRWVSSLCDRPVRVTGSLLFE